MAKLDQEQVQNLKSGKLKMAQVFPVDAEHVASVLLVGHLFYAQGKIPAAQRIFEGLLILDSRNPYVHAMLGSIYQKQEQYRSAFRHYTRAIEIFPKDIESLVNRGEIFLRFGRFKEAFFDFKAAVDLDLGQKSPAANRARLLAALAQESLQVAIDKGLPAAVDAQKALKTSLNLK